VDDIGSTTLKKGEHQPKTHDEILDLFKELESMEQDIIDVHTTSDELDDAEFDEYLEDLDDIYDTITLPDFQDEGITSLPEPHPEPPSITHHNKPQDPHKTKRLFSRKQIKKEKKIKERPQKKKKWRTAKSTPPKPVKSTFTLRLNSNGELVGLYVKKPPQPKEKIPLRQRLTFKRKKQPTPSADQPKVKGIKALPQKIKAGVGGLRSKLPGGKKGKPAEKSSANPTGKLKAIFKRKK